jgi:hypothetical protein
VAADDGEEGQAEDLEEAPMPDLNERADAAAREFREAEGSLEHGRAELAERGEGRPVDPESGPGHYAEASRYAQRAAKALDGNDVTRAQALAAIGQLHATLAAAAATALHEEYSDIRAWRRVTGQE